MLPPGNILLSTLRLTGSLIFTSQGVAFSERPSVTILPKIRVPSYFFSQRLVIFIHRTRHNL